MEEGKVLIADEEEAQAGVSLDGSYVLGCGHTSLPELQIPLESAVLPDIGVLDVSAQTPSALSANPISK